MKKHVIVIVAIIGAVVSPMMVSVSSQSQDVHVTDGWLNSVKDEIRKAEYLPSLQTLDYKGEQISYPRYHFVNRIQNLRAYFDENGMEVMPRQFGDKPFFSIKCSYSIINNEAGKEYDVENRMPRIIGNKIVYQYQDMTEEYANSMAGITQNIIIHERSWKNGTIRIRNVFQPISCTVETQRAMNSIRIIGESMDIVYQIVSVKDAHHTDLNACLSLEQTDQIIIVINDEHACYPVIVGLRISSGSVDCEALSPTTEQGILGLSEIPDWIVESNQDTAYFGHSVATAGDVNGDGYSDVIVAANWYDNGQVNEGRAFVYHGSSSGLSTSPDWTAESDQEYAGFGRSVATAGDVDGDGYSDIIVGASGYDNGQVNEGRAFVYHGSSSGLSTSPDWTAESDQEYAYFGWSVGTAGDVNSNGYSDVIVGSMFYDNGQTDEGMAFVYHGSVSGLSSTPDWTAESDQEYAYFAWSVGMAGDVNGDGYSDVIVGAPHYDNGEADEGMALVYYGSASGLSATPDWIAESDQELARFGNTVAQAGDVNGDGYADVIVGTPFYENGQLYEGGAWVYHGSASGLSATPDWTAEGNQLNAYFGNSVAQAGDVNGDGYADVIVGASYYSNGQTYEGRAYVYHGSASGLSTSADWIDESDQEGALYGNSVSTAGDVNGDGYSDVIVGAEWYDNGQTDEGRAFVYHGSSSGLSTSANWTAESDQADADFGVSVSTAGDVNGDGYSDVIVGARFFDGGQNDEGRAFVYHGSSSGLSTSPDWIAEPDQALARFGFSVAQTGDVNGDRYSDVIVGAPYYTNGQTYEGRAFVYHGSASGLSTAPDWSAEADQTYAAFALSVATAGDVDGDGYSDIIVGSPFYDNGQTDEGLAYVYHGSASGLSTTPDWTAESDYTYAQFGFSVAQAGDVNGDGHSDVIIGAYGISSGQPDEGWAFVYHGSSSGLSTSPDWIAESNLTGARFGYSVAPAGDVNDDGYSDVIVGAPYYTNGQTDEGRAYVFHGSATGLSSSPDWTAEPDQLQAYFGYSVAQAGDVNGDGYSDIIVGSPFYDNGQTDEGRAFVYHGSSSGLPTTADWTAESDQADANFGVSVATAGDVNGDGYSDVIVGALWYDEGQTNEGKVFVYYGNGEGLVMIPQQFRLSTMVPVQLLNSTEGNGVTLGLWSRTPAGFSKVKLQWEMKELGQPMNGSNLGESSDWYDTGLNGIQILEDVSGLEASKAYHWRVRLKYWPLHYNGSIYSRWLSIGPNSWNEKDFITSNLAVEEISTNEPSGYSMRIMPTISNRSFEINYTVCSKELVPVSIKIYDVSGRLIKTVVDSRQCSGSYTAHWHGDDDRAGSVAGGVYFAKFEQSDKKSTKKIVYIH